MIPRAPTVCLFIGFYASFDACFKIISQERSLSHVWEWKGKDWGGLHVTYHFFKTGFCSKAVHTVVITAILQHSLRCDFTKEASLKAYCTLSLSSLQISVPLGCTADVALALGSWAWFKPNSLGSARTQDFHLAVTMRLWTKKIWNWLKLLFSLPKHPIPEAKACSTDGDKSWLIRQSQRT